MFTGLEEKLEPRDFEETPPMHPEPPQVPSRTEYPYVRIVPEDRARPCYICFYNSTEVLVRERYVMYLHQYCWSVWGRPSR